jgi:hypothetical protein
VHVTGSSQKQEDQSFYSFDDGRNLLGTFSFPTYINNLFEAYSGDGNFLTTMRQRLRPIRLPIKPKPKSKIAKYLEPFHTAALVTITLLLIAGILSGYLLLQLISRWFTFLLNRHRHGHRHNETDRHMPDTARGPTRRRIDYDASPWKHIARMTSSMLPSSQHELIHTIQFYNLLLVVALFFIFLATMVYMVLTCKALRGGSYVDGVWMCAYCCIAGLICCLISAILTDSLQRELGLSDYESHFGADAGSMGYETVIDEDESDTEGFDRDDEKDSNNALRHYRHHHSHRYHQQLQREVRLPASQQRRSTSISYYQSDGDVEMMSPT